MADGAGACDVYPEDEGGDFGGGREGDVRAEAKPSRYLPFQDFMLVGFKGGGKTSWLIKFLMWWTTAFCLSLFYDEVVIICTDAGSGFGAVCFQNGFSYHTSWHEPFLSVSLLIFSWQLFNSISRKTCKF